MGSPTATYSPLTTADSVEAGLRVDPVPALTLSATAFRIVVSNELVFDHLAGRFLSASRTERRGVEAVVEASPAEWLRLQADRTWTDGRFTATDEPIPYAPRVLLAAGAFVESAPVACSQRLTAGLRAWYLGVRPLPDGFASPPAVAGAFTSRWQTDRWSIGLALDNVFVGRWRDGEFVFPSWFDLTEERSELRVLHLTAGDPFVARIEVGGRW